MRRRKRSEPQSSSDRTKANAATRAELAQLFATPPERFVVARNELAAQLQERRSDREAAQIKAVPKPTLPVWAINQLARQKPKEIAALLESGDQLREVQARALRLSGKGSEELRSAARSERQAVAALVRAAGPILASAGHAPSAGQLGRIESTLHAVAVGAGADRALLREGQLARELEQVGFPEMRAARGSGQWPQDRVKTLQNRRAGRDDAKRALDELRASHRRAQRTAKALAAAARRAQQKAERLRATATRAQERASKADAGAVAAEREAEGAGRSLQDAQRKVDEMTQRLARAAAGFH